MRVTRLVALAVMLSLCAGCDAFSLRGTDISSGPPARNHPAAEHDAGERAEVVLGGEDSVALTVAGAGSYEASCSWDCAEEGREQYGVRVRIENTGARPYGYSPQDFLLEDLEGDESEPATDLIGVTGLLAAGELDPGVTVSGLLVFEIEQDPERLDLVWFPNPISQRTEEFALPLR